MLINYSKNTLLVFIILVAVFKIYSENTKIDFTGEYRNFLLVHPEYFDDDRSVLDINRLRLGAKLLLNDNLSAEFIGHHEIYVGDYISSYEFNSLIDPYNKELGNINTNKNNYHYLANVKKAIVQYQNKVFKTVIGRQNITLGTGFFWSNLEVLNSLNRIQIVRGEREGVDAALFDVRIRSKSLIRAFGAGKKKGEDLFFGLKYTRSSLGDFDISATGLYNKSEYYKKDEVLIGLDFRGYVGGAGIRGELTFSYNRNEQSFSGVFGGNYRFNNGIYVMLEYFYSGLGEKSTNNYRWDKIITGEITTLSNNYLGLLINGEINPLLKLEGYAVSNINDKSFGLSPSIKYSATASIDISFGVKYYYGKENTEFNQLSSNVYLITAFYF